jgi:hypothetical protein
MIETTNYWIYENKFIFKPKFNKSLDKYYNLISKYDQLIFSNYDNLDATLKTSNEPDDIYITNLFESKFNQPIQLNKQLTHVVFGCYFNQPIELNENLIKLTLGHCFNQPIQLNKQLTHLIVHDEFNKQIIMNDKLTHLTLGCEFNQKINLPETLIYLDIQTNPFDLIDFLPNKLEELILNTEFNSELNNLPNSIKIIKLLNSCYNKKLNNLPDSIQFIALPCCYELPIDKFSNDLKKIKCYKNYKYINDFIDKYEILYYFM